MWQEHKHLVIVLLILSIFIISVTSFTTFILQIFAQGEGMPMMTSNSGSGSQETITSYKDALIKAPLLVSQITIIGIVFNHIVFSKVFHNRILVEPNKPSQIMQKDIGATRKVFLIRILSVIVLLASSSGLFILEVYNLSAELGLSFSDTFSIVLDTSLGTVWLLRIITSVLIFILLIIYYISVKQIIMSNRKKTDRNRRNQVNNVILLSILILGSINILSNSIVSHNAAVSFFPEVAVSTDWIHVMAISIWLGGLFYISTILLYAIRTSSNDEYETTTKEELVVRNCYSLAVMLPYFSIIAIICLGVIGISGLYMAWLQLQSIGTIFDSLYGNILIVKLCVIVPMILLGGYHQIKLHFVMVQVAQRGNKSQNQFEILPNFDQRNSKDVHNRKGQFDPFKRFSKTIKIESMIGILVLVVSAFLTITSPPSMQMSGSQMQMQGPVGGNPDSGGSGSEEPRTFDGFTIMALVLAIIVLIMSLYYYRKSRVESKIMANVLKKN
jgi:copper transport protein